MRLRCYVAKESTGVFVEVNDDYRSEVLFAGREGKRHEPSMDSLMSVLSAHEIRLISFCQYKLGRKEKSISDGVIMH